MAVNTNANVNTDKTQSLIDAEGVLERSISLNTRDIEEPHVNSDVENAFFGEDLPSRSTSSRAIFAYDVPEVEDFSGEFVYNYFTKDERVRKITSPEDQIINIDADNTSDVFFQVKNDKLPRFVKFSFKPAKFIGANVATNSATIIKDNLDK